MLRAHMVPACAARAYIKKRQQTPGARQKEQGGRGAQQAPREQPLWANHELSRRAIAQEPGPHHVTCRMVPACTARAFMDSGSRPQVPHSGYRGGRGRSRRHANSRRGPTARSPEELLHRSGTHTMLRGRMVPACAVRANTDSGSSPQVPHRGHRGGRGGAEQAPRKQPLRAHHDEPRGAIAQKRVPHHATWLHGTRLRGARVHRQRQQSPGAPQRAQRGTQQAPREQTLRAHHVGSRRDIAQERGSYHAMCPHGPARDGNL